MITKTIQVKDLSYNHSNGEQVLRNINLSITQGKKLALLGNNGAGKTTLILHLNGILRPNKGEVYLDGKPVDYSKKTLSIWRSQVGIVFQNPDEQLFAGTVYQDISFGPLNLGLAKNTVELRVKEVLETLSINNLAHRPITSLSLGEKKKVAIAGILAMQPKVIILDEVTAGLDNIGIENLLLTLSKLSHQSITIVLATHDMDLAYSWADEVAILDQGKIISQDSVDKIFLTPLLKEKLKKIPLLLELTIKLKQLGWIKAESPLPKNTTEFLSLFQELRKLDDSISKQVLYEIEKVR